MNTEGRSAQTTEGNGQVKDANQKANVEMMDSEGVSSQTTEGNSQVKDANQKANVEMIDSEGVSSQTTEGNSQVKDANQKANMEMMDSEGVSSQTTEGNSQVNDANKEENQEKMDTEDVSSQANGDSQVKDANQTANQETMDTEGVSSQTTEGNSQVKDSNEQKTEHEVSMATANSSLNQMSNLKEYEIQYFGFTPQSFVNGVFNAMVDYLQDIMIATQNYILKQFASDDISEEAVKQSSDELFAMFLDTFNQTFDKLESYLLKNIFHIPSNVVLPEDKINQEHQYTDTEESQLDRELDELRQKIKGAMYVNARLRQYMKDIEIVQAQLDAFLDQLNTWHALCKQNNVPNLAESITFVGNKMTGLQQQLTSVLQQKKTWNQDVTPETQIEMDSGKL